MDIHIKKLALLSYLYMLIPIVLFFFGWLKLGMGIICTIILLAGFLALYRQDYQSKMDRFHLSFKQIVICILGIFLFVWLSGAGGFFLQTDDNHCRNAIFRDLIRYSWPVRYTDGNDANLVYYFTHWLVPAFGAKFIGLHTGWLAGNILLFLWDFAGIALSVLLILYVTKAYQSVSRTVMLILFLILWSGLNYAGHAFSICFGFTSMPFDLSNNEGWLDFHVLLNGYETNYLYRGNLDAMSQVYNQAIVPWVAVPLFLENRNIKNLAFLGLCVLPFAPIPFVGIFLLFIGYACCVGYKEIRNKKIEQVRLKNLFSFQNICACVTLLPVFGTFFSMNAAVEENSASIFFAPLEAFEIQRMLILLLFYLFEFGIYGILLYPRFKKVSLYWIGISSLVIIPLFRIGGGRDFCMNASLPALYMFMIFMIGYLPELKFTEKNKYAIIACYCTLTIAFASPIAFVIRSVTEMRILNQFPIVADDLKTFRDENIETMTNFLIGDQEEKLFYKYFGKN